MDCYNIARENILVIITGNSRYARKKNVMLISRLHFQFTFCYGATFHNLPGRVNSLNLKVNQTSKVQQRF